MSVPSLDPALRAPVEDTVIRLFVATDERNWPVVESCFTEPFMLDMTSVEGGAPALTSARQVTQLWAEAFRPLDHVHHQVGNFQTRVEGARASVRCYGIAFHYRGGIEAAVKSRTFVGSYEFELARHADAWRIGMLRFNLKFIDGNRELEKAL
jgi:SnoaL-like domain